MQNLVLGQVGRFSREVYVHDTAVGSSQVGDIVLQVGNDRVKTVLYRTEGGTDVGYGTDVRVQSRQLGLSTRLRQYVDRRSIGQRRVVRRQLGSQVGSGYRYGVVGRTGRANLEGQGVTTRQQRGTVKLGSLNDTRNFLGQLVHFFLQLGTVSVADRAVGRLGSNFTDTLQVVGNLTQGTFSRLTYGDTVIGITDSLVVTADGGGQGLRNRHAGSIILGTIHAQAGRQALQRSIQGVARIVQVVLRDERRNIGIDGKCHDDSP